MPYDSVNDAVKKHPNLEDYSDKAQRAWVKSWNNAWEQKKDESYAFAVAYSVANKIDGKKKASVVQSADRHVMKRIMRLWEKGFSVDEIIEELSDESPDVIVDALEALANRGDIPDEIGV